MQITTDILYPALGTALPNMHNVRFPKIQGALGHVYFVDQDKKQYVVKFNPQHLVLKNVQVANIFQEHNIPAPASRACARYDTWMEVYPQIQGRTLFERIGDGLPSDKVREIYQEILTHFAKMEDINFQKLSHLECRHFHQVARYNVSDTNNAVTARIIQGLVRVLNIGKKQDTGLYHAGITPKNVILSPDDRFAGFIDLDEAAICNKNYAFGSMATKYAQLGYDIRELFDYYERLTGKKLDRRRISAMADLNNIGKCILGKTARRSR